MTLHTGSRLQSIIPKITNATALNVSIVPVIIYTYWVELHIKYQKSTESSSFGSTTSCLLSVHRQNCLPFQIIRCIFIVLTGQYQVYYIMQNCLITESKMFVPQKIDFHVITLPGDCSSMARLQKRAFNRLLDEQNLTSSKDTVPAPRAPTRQCGGRLRFPVLPHRAWSIAVSMLSEESLALLNLIFPQRRCQNSQSNTMKVHGLCSQRTILLSKY